MAIKKLWQYNRSFYLCPLCGANVNWICYGATGHATCARSLHARQEFRIGAVPNFCTWKGKVERDKTNRIIITYDDGES